MYQYDQFDHAIVADRVADFRDQVERRLDGRLSEEAFRPLRLMNGLYLQLHAYMLRVAIPYGTLSARQLRMLAHIARRYDKGYGHFTTRQNIQYNWIKLAEAPDILAELASVEMQAIQTSGNCIRNITTDQFAGAAADEIADPRPYAELLRQYSTFHPEFSFLPRKFKIALTACPHDRAAIRFHDIGLEMRRDDNGQIGWRVHVGGGMGRTPMTAKVVRDWLPQSQLLSYVEAIMRVYNRYGRRDNIYKARIKILVHELGLTTFQQEVEAEWALLRESFAEPVTAELTRIAAHFTSPKFEAVTHPVTAYEAAKANDPAFAHWAKHNIHAHRAPGYAIVTISLKAVGEIPGDATASQMDALADLATRYSFDEIRVTHEQNLVLPHVKLADLYAVHAALQAIGLATSNVGLASDIIVCPGLDYCALANARSIPVAQDVAQRLAPQQDNIGELKIKISGCINACGHHHAGHIGILGVDKKGEENYQVLLGGSGAEDASIATILGPGFSADGVAGAVEKIVAQYLAIRTPGERLLDTYRRVGATPFKEAVYG